MLQIKYLIKFFLLFSLVLVFLTAIKITENNKKENLSCVTSQNKKIVGNSLSGIFKNGDNITVYYGYYDCNEIKRGDIVMYNYTGSSVPVIKIVRGIPHDKVELKKGDGFWHLMINGSILRNSLGEPYRFSENRRNMLDIYIKNYNGTMPENAYLLLGNTAAGSTDSSLFGFAGRKDIIGKVA